MKSNQKKWRNIMAMAGMAVSVALAPLTNAFADGPKGLTDDGSPGVYPPNENVLGMTYGDWAAAWWQWALQIPMTDNHHPIPDTTGEYCKLEQSTGPVFFLAGAWNTVTRNCTVPAGKPIFFPIINTECSTAEVGTIWYGSNPLELRNCAAAIAATTDINTLKAKIDSKPVKDLRNYRAQSPVFDLMNLPDNNYLGFPCPSCSSVTDGYWLMLKPLSPGNHKIHFEGTMGDFSINVTYNLTVTP